jgi:hypothetical protein
LRDECILIWLGVEPAITCEPQICHASTMMSTMVCAAQRLSARLVEMYSPGTALLDMYVLLDSNTIAAKALG